MTKKEFKTGDIIVVNLGKHKNRTYSGKDKLCMFLWSFGCKCKVIPITSRYNNLGQHKKINDIDILISKGEGNLEKDSVLLISDDKTVDILDVSEYKIGRFSVKILNEIKSRYSIQIGKIAS